jgi:hypothetical protein
MSRLNLFFKVEIEPHTGDSPERLAGEIARQVMKVYGVRAAELLHYVAADEE